MTQVTDLTAPIIPGESLGGIALGADAKTIIPNIEILQKEIIQKGLIRYETDSIDIWVKDSEVVKLAALDNYTGTIDGKVGIGASIKKTVSVIGPLEENFDEDLIAPKVKGVCFKSDGWIEARTKEMNLAVNLAEEISEIFVFKE